MRHLLNSGLRVRRSLFTRLSAATLLCLTALTVTPAFATSSNPQKILVVSDIHFNPMADSSLVSQLNAAEPSQWESILNKTAPHTFSPYGQDTNWWLLQSSLDAMHNTLPHPAVFLILGDMLAHEFPETYRQITHSDDRLQYRAFVLKTIQFLSLQLRRRWPDTQIVLTPGNDDDECDDYAIEAGGAYLSDTAAVTRELAKADEQTAADWKALGSYTAQPAAVPGLKIVSFNSIFFSEKYEAQSFEQSCAEVQTTAPSQTFAWLEQTIAAAQQENQKVWLMFHVPPGIDGYASTHNHEGSCTANIVPLMTPEWTNKLDSLIMAHPETIAATFAGHTHIDSFRVLREGTRPKAFVLVHPPISPVYYQNPAFQVLDVNGSEVLDQTTYYLTNLTSANAKQSGRWEEEYTFSREWKAKRLDASSLGEVNDRIASNDAARARWLKLYNVSSSAAKVKPDEVRGLYCTIEGLGVGAYAKCACNSGK